MQKGASGKVMCPGTPMRAGSYSAPAAYSKSVHGWYRLSPLLLSAICNVSKQAGNAAREHGDWGKLHSHDGYVLPGGMSRPSKINCSSNGTA